MKDDDKEDAESKAEDFAALLGSIILGFVIVIMSLSFQILNCQCRRCHCQKLPTKVR